MSKKKVEIFNHSYNRPLNEHVIVFLDLVPAEKSEGGLYYTEKQRDMIAAESSTGILLAVGTTAFKDYADKPKLGDRVKFQSYVGGNVREGGNFYRLLTDREIRAVYERPDITTMNK